MVNVRFSGHHRTEAYLPHNSALKHDKHEECKETIVPILVKTPKGDTKDLEDKERRRSMFQKQFCEGGDGDIELVLSVLRDELFCFLMRETLGLAERGDGGLVGTRVSQSTEGNRV
jgi:hypothetical protein